MLYPYDHIYELNTQQVLFAILINNMLTVKYCYHKELCKSMHDGVRNSLKTYSHLRSTLLNVAGAPPLRS